MKACSILRATFMCMNKWGSFLVCILLLMKVSSQEPKFTQYQEFKVEDGLPQNFVSGIQQDKDGFLWIGTRDGLARYDGHNFRVFRSKNADSLSLSSNLITGLYLDAKNMLWVFYVNDQVDCFDPSRLQVIHQKTELEAGKQMRSLRTKKIFRDRSGNIWLSCNNRGIVRLDKEHAALKWYTKEQKNLESNQVVGILEDNRGRLFIFTDKGVESPGQAGSFVPYPPAIPFSFTLDAHQTAYVGSNGQMYISVNNLLVAFDPDRKEFRSYRLPAHIPDKPGIIRHLQTSSQGVLYVVAAGGIYSFVPGTDFTWLWQSPATNKFAGDFKSFLCDRSDVAWLGTNAFGMYKINLHALPFTSRPLTVNFCRDVLSQTGQNPLPLPTWFSRASTSYGLRYAYGPDSAWWMVHQEREEDPEPLSLLVIKNNTCIRAGSVPGTHAAIRGISRLPSGKMLAMDYLGNTWTWDKSGSVPVFTASALSLPQFSAVVDLETDSKALWVSTNKEGLYKIEGNKVTAHFYKGSKENRWPSNQLTDLCTDPADRDVLWIGTLGYGLIRLNKSNYQMKVFTMEEGLPNNTVYSIVPDKTGNLWLSTNKGLCRFGAADFSCSNFDVGDGLPGNEFNRFHHLQLPDGRIAFGTTNACVSFDPASFSADSFATGTVLTNILINNSPVEYTGDRNGLPAPVNELKELTLPYYRNFLQFEFAGLQFNQPNKIRYRYQLVGYDNSWIETGNRNLATYTKLPPGRYTLLLNASNTSGKWSPQVRQLAIRIRPPLWASGLAYAFYTVVLLLLALAYYRYRVNRRRLQLKIAAEQNKARQLQELDMIKERFFSNITHELRTPLTLILTPLEKLKENNHLSEPEQQYLTAAHRNAGQLLRLINQLLDISKIESKQMKLNFTVGELSDFAERCVEQFRDAADTGNIRLHVDCTGSHGHYQFDEDKWEKILFNLLSNALKFTGAGGEITVTLNRENGPSVSPAWFRLSVSDTGKGIAAADIPRLFDRFYTAADTVQQQKGGTGIGLSLVKELTELMQGDVTVTSTPGKGSCFTVRIPVQAADSPVNSNQAFRGDEITGIQQVSPHPENTPLILVAEDNEELRSFLVRELSQYWRILEASNGEEAWERTRQELPEIVISDHMMPGYNGETLCRMIKGDPRLAHISFIMLTARAAQQHVEAALQAGADAYLTKPFHLAELELRIRNLLVQQQRLRDHFREQLIPEKPPTVIPHLDDIFLQTINHFLEQHLDRTDLDVEQLAAAVSMSRRTLSRKLKTILNIGPNDLIRRFRLQKAAVYLSAGQSISDTAYLVGFETPSYFSQCFKEQYGQTPSEFAKNPPL